MTETERYHAGVKLAKLQIIKPGCAMAAHLTRWRVVNTEPENPFRLKLELQGEQGRLVE